MGKPFTYGSVCSGIEAATVAWHPLGWKPAFFSEIDAFPRAVLAHHYPDVPLHGDFTTIQDGQYEPIDLLVGGTPCQSFSVAGLRGGLDDERGNLALEYLRLAQRLRPRWLVWENVPGVLSSNRGRDFGAILGGMVELGYGIAYRVLDAQFFGVAQRRRRVFVVGYLGDWRRAAAVLFERDSLSGNPPPRRATPKGTAYSPGFGAGGNSQHSGRSANGRAEAQAFGGGGHCNPTDVATAVSAHPGGRFDLDCDTFIAASVDTAPTLRAGGNRTGGDRPYGTDVDTCDSLVVSHSLRGEGFDASEDGTGRGTPIIPVVSATLGAAMGRRNGQPGKSNGDLDNLIPAAFQECVTGVREYESAGTLRAGGPGHDPVGTRLRIGDAVRRLTPTECERLQGFPDDYTLIPWRGKTADQCPDGPRYKALGNSMAVPCMAWIGRRIAAVEAIQSERVAA